MSPENTSREKRGESPKPQPHYFSFLKLSMTASLSLLLLLANTILVTPLSGEGVMDGFGWLGLFTRVQVSRAADSILPNPSFENRSEENPTERSHTYQSIASADTAQLAQSQEGTVLQASDLAKGYIQLAPGGKGLVYSNTGELFVPLGWKPTWPWFWQDGNNPAPNIDNRSMGDWVRELSENGVNFINIWLNTNHGAGVSFEHNVGEFNIGADNGSDRMMFVSDPDDVPDRSNITQLIKACEKYGVKIKISIYRQPEFKQDWNRNPYNGNRDTSSYWCSNSPRGCLPGPAGRQPDALNNRIQLQKDRFKFIYDAWGQSKAIAVWELMVELCWLSDEFNGYDNMETWVREMKRYIEEVDQHSRPVLVGSVREGWRPWGSEEDPGLVAPGDRFYGFNELLKMDAIDIVSYHNYSFYNLWDRFAFHREIEEYYPGKTIHFGGGSGSQRSNAGFNDDYGKGLPPSVNGPTIPDYMNTFQETGHYEGVVETRDPWINTKSHVWVNLIASGGTGTATRCPCKIRPYSVNGFSSIYYAPSRFLGEVNWSAWDLGNMHPWEDWRGRETWGTSVRGASMIPWVRKTPEVKNADFLAATGDGDQLMMIVRGSQNDVTLRVGRLASGTYTMKVFDWLTGDVVETRSVSLGQSMTPVSLNLSDGNLVSNGFCATRARSECPTETDCCMSDMSNPYYSRRRMAIVYFEKRGPASSAPTPTGMKAHLPVVLAGQK